MSLSSSFTNITVNMITVPAKGAWNIQVKASASTHYCMQCDNRGFVTYVLDGEQGHSRCPDCVNRQKGPPIPHTEIGVD
jgi:hypothetical protein